MIKIFSEELYERLTVEMESMLAERPSALGRFTHSVKLAEDAVNELLLFASQHSFSDSADEIHYHKHILPKFRAVKCYETSLFHIEKHRPFGSEISFQVFLEEELAYIRRWQLHHEFAVSYYKMQLSEYDVHYFLERKPVPHFDWQEVTVENGPECQMGYLFAKIMAFERLEKKLLEQLMAIQFSNGSKPSPLTKVRRPFKWTGKNIDIIEMVYGLYLTGNINNGAATLAEIVRWFEEGLQVRIPLPSKTFANMKQRTVLSPTAFLERMKRAIEQHIDDDNSIENVKRENRRYETKRMNH